MISSSSVVTDAKSLFDHLGRTGGVPTERQTLLDLLVAREMMEADIARIRWVPPAHQLADPLTKSMDSASLRNWLATCRWGLRQGETQQEEDRRKAGLRKGQRERRKNRMKAGRKS